jgi:ribulose-phosphate 3-epimerase
MIENPEKFIADFAAACIQTPEDRDKHFLSVHVETCPHLHRALETIRSHGLRPGVVINPGTPVSVLDVVLPQADLVLCMSVDPGFGGQAFIEAVKPKVREVRRRVREIGREILIEVDGGVKVSNIAEICACGADVLVAGSEVFGKRSKGNTPADMVRALYKAIEGVNPYAAGLKTTATV